MTGTSLDRFAVGLQDAQDTEELHRCDECGGEIYPGEGVYEIEGDIIHERCLGDYAKGYFEDYYTTIEDALEVA
ncbi:hypothetical protein [Petroclostridium sp. X23]|uniref:hypothetical protein n=1 Tax=Petroclostridium sp. X23 TaxID=3045146 RepID=UPI0024AC8FD2|nr:hypothetical protein [Petroclostridium sp. X23]WHH58285.1 hypothetical protein QKW49_21175 [Petroclostridium sp. X23]